MSRCDICLQTHELSLEDTHGRPLPHPPVLQGFSHLASHKETVITLRVIAKCTQELHEQTAVKAHLPICILKLGESDCCVILCGCRYYASPMLLPYPAA